MVVEEISKYDLIERFNYISIIDPKAPPPPSILDFSQEYFKHISQEDQYKIRQALAEIQFDVAAIHTRRKRQGRFQDVAEVPEDLVQEPSVEAHSNTPSLITTHEFVIPEGVVPTNDLEEEHIPKCNKLDLSDVNKFKIAAVIYIFFNFTQVIFGFMNLVIRDAIIERPFHWQYLLCREMKNFGDPSLEWLGFWVRGPYSMFVFYLNNKFTSYLCIGHVLATTVMVMLRFHRDMAHLFWSAYFHEFEENLTHFIVESVVGLVLDTILGFLMLVWFYVIHENKMLWIRELKQSRKREINREIDAKYLNRIKARRKVIRQSGRINKGRVVHAILKDPKRSLYHPTHKELHHGFSEGMNRYRILCGAEWLRELEIPQGFTFDNRGDVPRLHRRLKPPLPPPSLQRRFTWSDGWIPPWRWIPPCCPPIMYDSHDLVDYVFEKPKFARFRDRLLLIYKSEDWLKAKRKKLKIKYSTGSFEWSGSNH